MLRRKNIELRHPELSPFEIDCLYWRGTLLLGRFRHWCYDWDDLPVDETCSEWEACCCNFGNEYGLPRHFGNPEVRPICHLSQSDQC